MSELADDSARFGAPGAEHPPRGNRHPRRHRDDGSSPPGLPARTPTGGWTGSTSSLATLDATIVHTAISRTVIDVNRDPSGALALSRPGDDRALPDHDVRRRAALSERRGCLIAAEIERRKARWFVPYHEALSTELERLRGVHEQVVLYDCHSIRSSIPRLFDGILPHFNIGTNGGASCAPELTAAVEAACDATSFSRVTNGRFRGG